MKQVIQSAVVIITLVFSVQTAVAFSGSYQEWKEQAVEEFDTNSVAFAYGKVNYEMRGLLQKRLDEAKAFIKNENDAVLWWLLGQLGQRKQLLYHYDLKVAGKIYHLNAPENQALIKEYQSYYQKAMDLDDNPDTPEHSTVMMLNGIANDSVGDPAIKVRALEKVAALARAGKNIGGSEMFEWNTYEARVGIYVDAKDYANALKIVNEMLERFPNTRTDELLNWKQNMESKVEKQKQQAAAQDAYTQADIYTAPKATPVQQPVKAVEPKKSEKPKANRST